MFRVFLVIFMLVFSYSFSQPIEPPKGERCVICGMDVNADPKFTSEVKLKNGKYKFSESPKHILAYYLNNKEKIAEIWVKDYKTGKWIDATKAYYVVINDGPMGNDLAPFSNKLDAIKFAGKNKVYEFKNINLEFLNHLEMGHIH